ncbi:hypothetical protein [Clostridium taeniosporum]|uniref:DUF8042 domain-containing protein n=1 Tax=Clostridium taeniosporum TaxID=394958 RepID=A0A1D7XHU0_9CLOT|nr:hypothetical protein [Clostridium taeniosporum]AOR22918.1 hypothetical protein BGI42_03955 [Clostridium taeniosporum]
MESKIEVLKTTSEYILQLEKDIIKVSKVLQGTEYKEGLKLINPITEGISWVAIAVENTREIHKEKILLDELNKKLKEIIQALENDDNILVADLFEYEILPIIKHIKEIIDLSVLN